MARRPSWLAVGLFGALVALGTLGPSTLLAAAPDWTATAAPKTLVYGTPTTIDVTITGGSGGSGGSSQIGCVEITLTNTDTANGATLTGASGLSWTVSRVPGSKDVVVLRATSMSDRLAAGQTLTVAIDVTTTGRNTEAWKVAAYPGLTSDPPAHGLGSVPIGGIAIVGAPQPTPKPTPSAKPTRKPTPTPTPTATPTPTPRPTPTSTSGDAGSIPSGSEPPGAAGNGAGGTAGGRPTPPPPIGSVGGLTVAPVGTSAVDVRPTVSIGTLTLGSSLKWLIPTFALSVPGMLIIGAVAIQLVTGLTFVDLTRRWLGAAFRRRREVGADTHR